MSRAPRIGEDVHGDEVIVSNPGGIRRRRRYAAETAIHEPPYAPHPHANAIPVRFSVPRNHKGMPPINPYRV